MERLLGKKVISAILSRANLSSVNEIRVRLNRNILIKCMFSEFFLDIKADKEYIDNIINVSTSFSRYAHEEEISDGFLSYGNGIRIGLCGVGKLNEKKLIAYSTITSVCIRIPHVIKNENAKKIAENYVNTLIIGQPYSGKTTIIREIASILSNKYDLTIIDERKEITGKDSAFFNGERADVIQGIDKKNVYENVIRSMSPQIVVFDEIFSDADFIAVMRIMSSGILCLSSYHADSVASLPRAIAESFDRIITLSSKPHPGSITSIVNKND